MAVSLSTPILVVDDYNTMVRILRNLLRQTGMAANLTAMLDGFTSPPVTGAGALLSFSEPPPPIGTL